MARESKCNEIVQMLSHSISTIPPDTTTYTQHNPTLFAEFSFPTILPPMSSSVSTRASFVGSREMTSEERKRALAARNQLSKGDEDGSQIIEGYQLLDVRL